MVRSTHWNVVRNTMRCARDALLSISAICRAISTEFQVPLSLNVRSSQIHGLNMQRKEQGTLALSAAHW